MIKREHIKQTIDEISKRDVQIGYSLDRMLSMGVIGIPEGPKEPAEEKDPSFLFCGEKVRINRILYFNEGTAPIEQGLLIKYGEISKKQELQDKASPFSYLDAFGEIRASGLRLAVSHEIDYAARRLKESTGRGDHRKFPSTGIPRGIAPLRADAPTQNAPGPLLRLKALLEGLKRDALESDFALTGRDFEVLYHGSVDEGFPAYFVRLPISIESLMQVADLNLEFFHVRFILECLIRGTEKNLFACVVGRRLAGLAYVVYKDHLFGKEMEIRFLSSIRGRNGETCPWQLHAFKGSGTFLVAGLWMLAKNERNEVKKIFLDSEVGSRGFYVSLGFEPMGPTGFVLKEPKGYLIKSILDMTHHCRFLRHHVVREIERILKRQIKSRLRKGRKRKGWSGLGPLLPVLMECFKSETRSEFGLAAAEGLMKYGARRPESRALIEFGLKNASNTVKAYIQNAISSCS